MAYSPYLPRTPQQTRTRGSSSAPTTPRLSHSVDHHGQRYASRLVHHDSNSEGGSIGFASPAHKSSFSTQSYGTLQTDISSGAYGKAPYPNRPQVVVDLSTPSDEGKRQIASLCKPVAWIWVIINVTTAGIILFCFLQPYWLINRDTGASLGIFNYCDGFTTPNTEEDGCRRYERHDDTSVLWTLPSLSWKVGTVVYMIACALLIISSLLASLCLCIPRISLVDRLSLVAGLQQLTAGVLLLTALITFPVGFDAREVKQVCGRNSTLYRVDECSIGWSYILSTACTFLCFTLPVLSHYITHIPSYSSLL